MKTLAHFLFSSTIVLVTAACQQNSSKTLSKAPDRIHQLRLNLSSEPPTMDPRKGGDIISSHMHFMLFEGLTRLNENGTISLAQAESIDISSDGKVYTFHLRDVHWSNGDPVTAEDYEKSWKDILDPAFPSVNAHLFYPIKNAEAAKKGLVPLSEVGIKSADSKTLIVTLDQPTPYFFDLIAFCTFFPVNKRIDEIYPDWAYEAGEYFASNGPYHLKNWKHNNEIIAVRNPYYWRKDEVLADSIHLCMIDNAMTALQMFENGELDIIGNPLSPLPVDALPILNKLGKLRKKPIAGTTIVSFNTQKIPFSNAKIRKAFGLAINREEIVTNITQLNEQIATNAIPPILKNNRCREFFKDHDIATAQQLFTAGLRELGVRKEELKEITYHYIISDVNHKIAQAIQQQIAKALGIKMQLEGIENKVFMDKLTKRDYSIAQAMWFAQYSDQMNIFERFKYRDNAKNYSHWENKEFIELLDRSAYETGEDRLATLENAEEIFLDEMPVAPIYHWEFSYMIQPYLSDVGLSPIGDVYFHDIDVTKNLRNYGNIAVK
jgi:oligopeptide transport system substrate-binding protein